MFWQSLKSETVDSVSSRKLVWQGGKEASNSINGNLITMYRVSLMGTLSRLGIQFVHSFFMSSTTQHYHLLQVLGRRGERERERERERKQKMCHCHARMPSGWNQLQLNNFFSVVPPKTTNNQQYHREPCTLQAEVQWHAYTCLAQIS